MLHKSYLIELFIFYIGKLSEHVNFGLCLAPVVLRDIIEKLLFVLEFIVFSLLLLLFSFNTNQ